MPEVIVSLDGQIIPSDTAAISVFDRGLIVGYGVFETFLALGDEIKWRDEHLARWQETTKAIGITPPFSLAEVRSFLVSAAIAHPSPIKRIRMTLSSGSGEMWPSPESPKPPTLAIIVTSHSLLADSERPKGVLALDHSHQHWLRRHKTTSWLPMVMPTPRSRPQDILSSFTLLHDLHCGVTEFTNANILVRQNDTIATPPGALAFPGITLRKALAKLADDGRFSVTERPVTLDELAIADEIIALSSLQLGVTIGSLCDSESNRQSAYTPREPFLAPWIRRQLLGEQYQNLVTS